MFSISTGNRSRLPSHSDDVSSIASSSALSRQDSFLSFSSIRANAPPNRSTSLNDGTISVDSKSSSKTNQSKSSGKTPKKTSSSQLPHYKAGRVKVGIRCRPPFQDEIDFAQGNFFSIVDCHSESENNLGRVALTTSSGKQRDFLFDYIFDQNTTQDYVYDTIARPVVNDVLKGFNGTIFAYGQTGTGKTYTMGILEFVNNEHAGIIPRAISQIFAHVDAVQSGSSPLPPETPRSTRSRSLSNSQPPAPPLSPPPTGDMDITITLSFLQIYRETIQDLLSPATGAQVGEDNLAIREDPQRGFYVEGLQEFIVRNYEEAEALLNLGLENRAIAPTLMNATSSRSHTILTINIEQRGTGTMDGGGGYMRTVRSKLLMVDLAGSERVRRTVSKGARLSEAKSINSSLSALGNVIAALAETKSSVHVPYRDSKLTRLLQDSLGGTASTALIASVGPAAINYGETLSTLLFATRCMAVKTTPVQHEEVDYADMCARLQEKVASLEGQMTEKMLEQQEKYEGVIRQLQTQLDASRSGKSGVVSGGMTDVGLKESGLGLLLDHLDQCAHYDPSYPPPSLEHWSEMMAGSSHPLDREIVALLGYCYELLSSVSRDSAAVLRLNFDREEKQHEVLNQSFEQEAERNRIREMETANMEAHDPMAARLRAEGVKIGSHLLPMSRLEALTKVAGFYRSNNDPVQGASNPTHITQRDFPPSFASFSTPQELGSALASMHDCFLRNLQTLSELMKRKDQHYQTVKAEMTDQLVERRKREEEVINWSYILKYLLSTSTKLRSQLQTEKKHNLHPFLPPPLASHVSPPPAPPSNSIPPPPPPPHLPLTSAFQTPLPPSLPANSPLSIFGGGGGGGSYLQTREVESFENEESERETPAPYSSMGLSISSPSPFPFPSSPTLSTSTIMTDPQLGLERVPRPQRERDRERERGPPRNPIEADRGREILGQMNRDRERDRDRGSHPQGLGSRLAMTQRALSHNTPNALEAEEELRGLYLEGERESEGREGGRKERAGGKAESTPGGQGQGQVDSTASLSKRSLNSDSSDQPRSMASSSLHSTPGPVRSGSGFGPGLRTDLLPPPIAASRVGPQEEEFEFEYADTESQSQTDVSDVGSTNLSFRSAATVSSIPLRVRKPPSSFAQEVVQELGVEGKNAVAAMKIIDKVTSITPDQMKRMDPETRAQILQIRRDLGIEDRQKKRRELEEERVQLEELDGEGEGVDFGSHLPILSSSPIPSLQPPSLSFQPQGAPRPSPGPHPSPSPVPVPTTGGSRASSRGRPSDHEMGRREGEREGQGNGGQSRPSSNTRPPRPSFPTNSDPFTPPPPPPPNRPSSRSTSPLNPPRPSHSSHIAPPPPPSTQSGSNSSERDEYPPNPNPLPPPPPSTRNRSTSPSPFLAPHPLPLTQSQSSRSSSRRSQRDRDVLPPPPPPESLL